MDRVNVQYTDSGEIIDFLTGKVIKDTPEERVRQSFMRVLCDDYGYPKDIMRREVPVQSGSSILLDKFGAPIRADIVVYNNAKAAAKLDQGNIRFVVECKKPNVSEGYAQLVSYIYNTSAAGGVWTNGDNISIYRKLSSEVGLEELLTLPNFNESWLTGEETIPLKSTLQRPHNIRFVLSICHNKLYGRGMENEDFDLTMDMVRILLAKIQDETSGNKYPEFWITEDEFKTDEGKNKVANKVHSLFRTYADQFPDVFDSSEKITVGNDCIAEAVGVLQKWSFAAHNDDADDWDLMGETYEQFTHINLKRQQGQFFTNRLVINMIVSMLDPDIDDRSLDPAGGGGGFATAIFRWLRRKIIASTDPNSVARERQLNLIKDRVFLVEIAARLVKIAKCAMLLTGDGQSGMTRGNSLDSYERFDDWIKSRCKKGSNNAPNVIATNPPFSGQKAESQIADKTILSQYEFGHSYLKNEDGSFTFCNSEDDILNRQAPELLFLERCVDWLRPGGRIGIVLPKGVLDNITYEAYRYWLLDKCELQAVITLHKDTFQPDTGVRTCVLILHKPNAGERPRAEYPVFMAQSQRIGQDSKGNNVYVLDGNGNPTDKLNQDLEEIARAYDEFKLSGTLSTPSEYIFTVKRSDIKDHLNINPQHYSPKLNKAIDHVLEYNDKEGWSVTTIGQIESGIKIYMGPRWNSSSIKVENPADTSKLTPYLTANGALELRRFTIKWMDLSVASQPQKTYAAMLKVAEGDILISRSGTIGKVTYATKDLATKYLVSDDLVRVRVKDLNLRAYLLAFLASSTALSLMLLDEYGSVQQHLQPRHIQEMIIPVPDDWSKAQDIISAGLSLIAAMESLSQADNAIQNCGFSLN